MNRRTTRIATATALVAAALTAGACSSTTEPAQEAATSTSTTARVVAPVPPSPIVLEQGLGVKLPSFASEDGFAATLASDPCSSTLTSAVQAILQNYQQQTHRLGATIAPADVTVAGQPGTSVSGMPQCTYTLTNAGTLSTLRVASTTAAANAPAPGRLAINDLAPDPTDYTQRAESCRIEDEFARTVKGIAGDRPVNAGVPSTGTRLDNAVFIKRSHVSEPGKFTRADAWSSESLVRAQVRCLDDVKLIGSRELHRSPDWLLQATVSSPAPVGSDGDRSMESVTRALLLWLNGGDVPASYWR